MRAETGRKASISSSLLNDNFARNKDWEAIFDRADRAEGASRHPTRPADPGRYVVPQRSPTVERRSAARVTRVFIGLENVNPDNLMRWRRSARTRSPKSTRQMLLAWKAQGIITLAGYASWVSPADTPETIRRDIEIIKRELALST